MLKITDKYYIDEDKYNYILLEKHIITEAEAEKRKNAVAGEEEFKPIGYFATVSSALRKLFEIKKKKLLVENITLAKIRTQRNS